MSAPGPHLVVTLDGRPAPRHIRLAGRTAEGEPFIAGGRLEEQPVVVQVGGEVRVGTALQAQVEVPDGARVTRLVIDAQDVPPELVFAGSEP